MELPKQCILRTAFCYLVRLPLGGMVFCILSGIWSKEEKYLSGIRPLFVVMLLRVEHENCGRQFAGLFVVFALQQERLYKGERLSGSNEQNKLVCVDEGSLNNVDSL